MALRIKFIFAFLFLLICFLFPRQNFAQTTYKFSDVVGIRVDSCNSFTIDSVVYTKFDMVKISGTLYLREIFKGDTAASCEGVHEYSMEFINGKLNGYLKHFRYDRGNKLLVDESNYKNGQLHGSVKHWSLSGQLIFSGSYSQGLKNGKFNSYGFDGKFKSEEFYSEGNPNGRFRKWDNEGKLVSDEMKYSGSSDMFGESFPLCPQCLEFDISNLLNKLQLEFFYMDDFFDKSELIADSVFVIKDENRYASLLITNGFLVASYQMTFGAEEGTIIIDLNSKKDLLEKAVNNFYVYGFDFEKHTLFLEDSGYDDNGRFWRNGQWSFMNRTAEFGKKTY